MHTIYRLKAPKEGASLPDYFSHSLLTKVERCPLQWWLLHSKYEGLEGRYPQAIHAATVSGKVVHATMEAFAHALRLSGNVSPWSSEYLRTRQSFPLRQTVLKLREKELASITGNPRVNATVVRNGVSVDKCINAFKRLVTLVYSSDRIKAKSSRDAGNDVAKYKSRVISNDVNFLPTNPPAVPKPDTDNPHTLIKGLSKTNWIQLGQVPCPASLPEVSLRISKPPLLGTIDLIKTGEEGDTIVEFKTGEPHPEHKSQSKLYAVLWWHQTRRPIRERLLLYTDYDPESLGGLNTTQLEEEKGSLQQRISVVQADFSLNPPPARPSPENCQLCPVRQLCTEYWHAPETSEYRWTVEPIRQISAGEDITEWRDIELGLTNAVITEHGFTVDLNIPVSTNTHTFPVRLVCNVPAKFNAGLKVRPHKVKLLSVGLKREGTAIRVIHSSLSEMFWS